MNERHTRPTGVSSSSPRKLRLILKEQGSYADLVEKEQILQSKGYRGTTRSNPKELLPGEYAIVLPGLRPVPIEIETGAIIWRPFM